MSSPSSPNNANGNAEESQVYVSHLCLHNFHPIFCRFGLDTVKLLLHYSSIVYLKPQQILYPSNSNLEFIYVVLFGKVKIVECES
jgi:hypothetical protein